MNIHAVKMPIYTNHLLKAKLGSGACVSLDTRGVHSRVLEPLPGLELQLGAAVRVLGIKAKFS